MSLITWKRSRFTAPTAILTLLCFLATMLPPRIGRADDPAALPAFTPGTGGPQSLAGPTLPANAPEPQATTDLSTGAAQTSYPFKLATARGEAQPSLGLSYRSSDGVGFAGVGWTLTVPSIVRKGTAGLPQFKDAVLTSPSSLSSDATTDDYLIDGQLLVPVAVLNSSGSVVSGQVLSGEAFPANILSQLGGGVYFRREVDDGSRYFFASNGLTWIQQSKDGRVRQYGQPLDESFPAAFERPSPYTATALALGSQNAVYRWNLVRDSDAVGNTVFYVYDDEHQLVSSTAQTAGAQFLTDIYDTRQSTTGAFAHHVHLTWELPQPPPTGSTLSMVPYATSPIWRAPPFAQLQYVDVTSATWGSPQRFLVRSYALSYAMNATQTRSFLTSIQMTGDCGSFAGSGHPEGLPPGSFPEDGNGIVEERGARPNGICAALPATTYSYSGVTGGAPSPQILSEAPWLSFDSSAGVGFSPPQIQVLDLNGDAIADLFERKQDSDTGTVSLGGNLGSGTATTTTCLGSNQNCGPGTDGSGRWLVGCGFPSSPCGGCGEGPWDFFGDWGSSARIGALFLGINDGCLQLPVKAATFSDPDPSGNIDIQPIALSSQDAAFLANFGPVRRDQGFDADGDGLPDLSFFPANVTPPSSYPTELTTRDHRGLTHPFRAPTVSAGTPAAFTSAIGHVMTDVDGDGLPDIAYATANSSPPVLNVLPSRGDGRFGLPFTPPLGPPATYGATVSVAIPAFGPFHLHLQTDHNPFPNQFAVGDLNGDGFADYVESDDDALRICLRYGSTFDTATWQCTSDTKFASPGGNGSASRQVQIADVAGSGVNSVIFFPILQGVTTATAIHVSPDGVAPNPDGTVSPRDGLLQTISNGVGATTTISYTPLSAVVGPSVKSPVPQWVVTSVLTTNGLTGNQVVTTGASYSYDTAIYDPRDRAFLGFRHVTEQRVGTPTTPLSTTTTTFGTDTCDRTSSCLSGSVDTSYFHAVRGLPTLVEVGQRLDSETTRKFSTIYNEYRLFPTYTGLDGRAVVIPSLFGKHTYLWDESQTVASTTSVQNVTQSHSSLSFPVSLPATQILHETDLDNSGFGNVFRIVDSGVIGQDASLVTFLTWNLPPNDTTGWSFRLTEKTEGPLGSSAFLRDYTYGYTSTGLLSSMSAIVTGGVALPGPDGTAATRAAPQPSDASTNSSTTPTLLGTIQYDPQGNMLQVQGPDNRCVKFVYDTLFNQLPQSVFTYPTGCVGERIANVTSLVFDRGLGRVTSSLSPDGRQSTSAFDDFGRQTAAFSPDPVALGATLLSYSADYSDVGPVRRVHFQTPDGIIQNGSTTFNPTIMVDHYRYVDGFGDTLVAIDQAGSVLNGSQWLVSGMHTRLPNGRVAQIAQQFFTTRQPSSFPLGTAPFPAVFVFQPVRNFTYDALGRMLSSTDFLGNPSTMIYHNAALSVDIRDADEQPGGLHPTAFSTVVRDGFGRVKEIDQTLSNVTDGPGVIATTASYNVTGEPISITQSFSGAGGTSVTRTMAYDTLGRMVQNIEPNVGTWTYAYNDAGDLAGVSDARGCGENIFHDGLGRTIGEDYSPCDPTHQAAYTSANVSTGTGLEALNRFDPDGLLIASADRAQSSAYQYDARGRLAEIDRRLAAPTSSSGSGSSGGSSGSPGAGIVSGTITDASGNPMSGITVTLSGNVPQGYPTGRTTGPNGDYSFTGLPSGSRLAVQASPPNSGCQFLPNGQINFNLPSSGLNLSFVGEGNSCGGIPFSTPVPALGNITISGNVTENGSGVPGLPISLNGTMQALTHTDSTGFYSFTGLGSGNYSINVNSFPPGCTLTPGASNNISASATVNITATGTCGPLGLPPNSSDITNQDTPHVFKKMFAYDGADRVSNTTTGADLPLLTTNGSQVSIGYDFRGILQTANSSYGGLLANTLVDALGNIKQQTFADVAATTATMGYDANSSLVGFALQRSAGAVGATKAWTTYAANSPPPVAADFTQQTVLASWSIVPDPVGNPTTLTESVSATTASDGTPLPGIVPSEWPDGAKPRTSQKLAYWDDYRLAQSTTQYAGTSGTTDKFSPGPYTPAELGAGTFPTPVTPSTHNRVAQQNFFYDWRGNMFSTDDANDFPDRSLSDATYGVTGGGLAGGPGPDQLRNAGPQALETFLAFYDKAGNLTSIVDNSTQHVYSYAWDELGRLASASRADNSKIEIQETFAYDAGGQRVRTSRTSVNGQTDHTLQVFDSLALLHAAFPGAPGDYERDLKTEHAYLNAAGTLLGHVFYDEGGTLPQSATGLAGKPPNGPVHLLMPLGDMLGSTSFVIDHDTSELVESATYLPYGGVDSDYRPQRWQSFREDVRYTGHWDDAEVGLVYFGARYYSPQLSRWISPDPLTIHGLAGDPNPYGFVSGSPMANVDPFGLQGQEDPGPQVQPTQDAEVAPTASDSSEPPMALAFYKASGTETVEVRGHLPRSAEPREAPPAPPPAAQPQTVSPAAPPNPAQPPSRNNALGAAPPGRKPNAPPQDKSLQTVAEGTAEGVAAGVLFVVIVVLSDVAAGVALRALAVGATNAAETAGASAAEGAGAGAAEEGASAGGQITQKLLNTANHIFGPKSLAKHNLGGLLKAFGGDSVAATRALEGATQQLANQGTIQGIFQTTVSVGGEVVTVQGRVINGLVNLSTAFIPP